MGKKWFNDHLSINANEQIQISAFRQRRRCSNNSGSNFSDCNSTSSLYSQPKDMSNISVHLKLAQVDNDDKSQKALNP